MQEESHVYMKLTGNVLSFLYCFGIPMAEERAKTEILALHLPRSGLLCVLFQVIIKSRLRFAFSPIARH
jgi:hypothetical protein